MEGPNAPLSIKLVRLEPPLDIEKLLRCRAVQQASATTGGLPQPYQGAFEPAPSTPTRARSTARAASATAPAPHGRRQMGQKTKTMKDLCMSPDSDAGVMQLLTSSFAGTKPEKAGVVEPKAAAGIRMTTSVGTAVKCERPQDIAAQAAAAAPVAAAKRRRLAFKPMLDDEQRQQETGNAASPADVELDARTLQPDGNGDAALLVGHGKRRKGSAGSKEVQSLASKVVVTPGQTRMRRNTTDQVWWVVN